jgi:hypothetical protein
MTDVFIAKQKKPHFATLNRQRQPAGLGAGYQTVAERLIKERGRQRLLSSFCLLPGRVRFETQEVRERIILLLRQHWLTQLKWILTALVMMLLPGLLRVIPLLDFLNTRGQTVALIIWYLLIIAFIYEQFISWYFHVFIVTDERIIDINFVNLIYKEISEAKIDNIEDVTYKQGGVMRAFFNFGDVACQTAAEQRQFVMENVPRPDRVVKILNELKLEEEHEKIIGKVR